MQKLFDNNVGIHQTHTHTKFCGGCYYNGFLFMDNCTDRHVTFGCTLLNRAKNTLKFVLVNSTNLVKGYHGSAYQPCPLVPCAVPWWRLPSQLLVTMVAQSIDTTTPGAVCVGKGYHGKHVGNHYHPPPDHGSHCFTMVASMVAQCKSLGKGLVHDLQAYHAW